MVTGFAAAGMVDLVPALAVTLGANVWTTLSRPAAATQINGHIVAASAYPLLERTGELLPSRRVARKR
jgi:Na+/phosphate symporter